MTEIRSVRPPTTQEAVLAEMRRLIASGEMRPGAQVVQDSLAEELGVSRVPLREALKTLEAEGLVTYRPHHGYFVTELSLDDLLEVYRIRELLETEAVTTALPLLTAGDVDRLAEAEEDIRRAAAATEIFSMAQANRRFHFALIEGCGRPRLIRLIGVLWDSTEVYRSVYFTDEVNRDRVDHEHRRLVAAIQDRDLDAVLHVLDEHRRHAIEALRPVLEAVGRPD
ncbi:MAG TPA: GntR family transcriptional regulator [Marmoricola sp.]